MKMMKFSEMFKDDKCNNSAQSGEHETKFPPKSAEGTIRVPRRDSIPRFGAENTVNNSKTNKANESNSYKQKTNENNHKMGNHFRITSLSLPLCLALLQLIGNVTLVHSSDADTGMLDRSYQQTMNIINEDERLHNEETEEAIDRLKNTHFTLERAIEHLKNKEHYFPEDTGDYDIEEVSEMEREENENQFQRIRKECQNAKQRLKKQRLNKQRLNWQRLKNEAYKKTQDERNAIRAYKEFEKQYKEFEKQYENKCDVAEWDYIIHPFAKSGRKKVEPVPVARNYQFTVKLKQQINRHKEGEKGRVIKYYPRNKEGNMFIVVKFDRKTLKIKNPVNEDESKNKVEPIFCRPIGKYEKIRKYQEGTWAVIKNL